MSQSDQSQAVRNYLSDLKAALVGLPHEVADEIVAGITEELAGVDATAAAARIVELGEPAFIAAEAKAGSDLQQPLIPSASKELADSRAYIVVTCALVALGGVVVPVAGWIVGVGMVAFSKTWYLWEKLVAIFAPCVALGLLILGAWLVAGETGGLTWWHVAILGAFFVPFLTGTWLLIRGMKRHAATAR